MSGRGPPIKSDCRKAEDHNRDRDLLPPAPSSSAWSPLYDRDRAALHVSRKRLKALFAPLAGAISTRSDLDTCSEQVVPPSELAAMTAALSYERVCEKAWEEGGGFPADTN
ncbi:Hypothetical predicted protein [Pelobates cultripes]|uniref:Uncharacterized protein n=1 Tax=Pelobates cultripes TaxID=61616 RepID=A0AAD1VR39_PELCU|nr:Hypothetical predicted protein [Pelobates cultripes]